MYEEKENETVTNKDANFNIKAGLFLTLVGGAAAISGFSITLATARKQEAKYFNEGITASTKLHHSGVNLALRALGWGTLYAISGTGILMYSIWKLAGVDNFKEFRYKFGSALPRIPKNNVPEGKTEFDGLTDLLDYLQTRK